MGLNLNLNIGIDFTGSNGHYLDEGTLHYLPKDPNQKTLYEGAIWECGKILENYDSDKIYPVFGFGACTPEINEVNHCFPLTLAKDGNPNILGLENTLKCYRENMPKLTFSGPTYFAPLLDNLFRIIGNQFSIDKKALNYNIILILTDGMINDIDVTIDCIVEASHLPVSIIIVGVGDADFSAMEFLDCDNGFLESKNTGKKASRDIVQFVEFKSIGNDPSKLAKLVLEELPKQVEEYFNKVEI